MEEYKGILVIGEQNGNEIHKVSYELLGKGRELADKAEIGLEVLILGNNMDVDELCYRGAEKVYYMEDECLEKPEEYLYKLNIVKFIEERKPEIVLIGATNFGRSLAPRIAGALKTGLTADCTELLINEENKLVQVRPAFSDNILAHIKSVNYPQMATIRYKEFSEASRDETREVSIERIKPHYTANNRIEILDIFRDDDFDITEAKLVVAVGRGLKDKKDMSLIENLADVLGGVVGVSRALVDAGLADSSHQVGYSGNRVKPKVYIACGISGAPQHVAGMKESDLIIAVNNDPSAPIFNIADIGYVGDMYEIIPEMIRRYEKRLEEIV